MIISGVADIAIDKAIIKKIGGYFKFQVVIVERYDAQQQKCNAVYANSILQ